jgi:Fe-S-cluster containining protein
MSNPQSPPPAHVCARCPRALGESCCEVQDGERLATLTWSDVDRIAAHTGRAGRSFAELDPLTESLALEYEARRPLYRGYFARGPFRLTLRRRAGACVFLDRARGCRLPPEVRPTACQLYPFELAADGSWTLMVQRFGTLEAARRAPGESCLAVEEARSLDELHRAFGLSNAQVESLAGRLREEVRAHAREVRTPP